MENKRMSELPVATTISDEDYTIIVQGGSNKRVSRGIFKQKEYNNLDNRPYINSNYSSSLVPTLELLQGTIQFHKISKTGRYGDLLDLPYIPVRLSDLNNDGYFVQDQYYVHTDNNLTSGLIDRINSAIQAITVNNNLIPPNASQEVNIIVPTKMTDLTNDGNFVQDPNYVHTDNNFNTNMKNSYDNLVVNVNQPVSPTNKIATMNDLAAIDGGYWVIIDIYKDILFDGVINTSETVPANGTYAVLEFKNNILVVNKYTNGVSDNSDIPFKEGYFVFVQGTETEIIYYIKENAWSKLGTDLGNYYNKQDSDSRFVAKETGKSLMTNTERTKLNGISTGANKVEKSNTNGNIKIDGTEITVYTKPDLTSSEIITALGFTPVNVTTLTNDYYNKTNSDNRYVQKETGKGLISTAEITRLSGMSTGANKVEASETNGNIKIDGVETVVYTKPALTNSEVITAIGYTPANVTALSNYYNKTNSDNRYVQKEADKSLIADSKITKLDGISAEAKKVEHSNTNGNILIDGVETTVYVLSKGAVIEALGYTPIEATVDLTDYYDKQQTDNKFVAKETGKDLISTTEITRLAGMSTGANKVEASETNGNIKIDGVETVIYTKPALTNSEVITAIGYTPANVTVLSNYYTKTDSDDRYVQKETGKGLISTTEVTRLAGMSTGANKVEASTTNGYIKIDGVNTKVYTKPALTGSEVTTALGFTPANSTSLSNYYTKDDSDDRYVQKENGKSLIADTKITKLDGISTGANKVEASNTNGNIKIDGVETTVYTKPALTKSEVTTALGYTPPTSSVVTTSSNGLMSKDMLIKLNGISTGANKVQASNTNGNILIDGTEVTVYTKPALTKADVTTALGYTPPTTDTNTTYDVVTASANGLMSTDMLAKLNGITADADSVSFTRSLSSGTKIGTITINGTATDLYAPTNTDTHYTSHLYVGTSSGSANAATTNGNTYLMVLDNTTVRDRRLIKGTGGTKVTSDSSGNITINSTQEPITIYADFMTNINWYDDGTDLTQSDGLTMSDYDKMQPGTILEYQHPYSYNSYCYSLILYYKSYYSYKDAGGRFYIREYTILNYNGQLGYYTFSTDPLSGGTSVYKGSNLDQDSGGGVACFTPDTLINTENGLKPIKDLNLDDKVYCKNQENQIVLREIVKTFSHITNKIYRIDTGSNIIDSSWSHPFYVYDKGKILAQDLKVGDKLQNIDNDIVTIENIEVLEEPTLVFEIRVKDNENYFVGTDKIFVGCERI